MGNDCIPSEDTRRQRSERSALPTRQFRSPDPSQERQHHEENKQYRNFTSPQPKSHLNSDSRQIGQVSRLQQFGSSSALRQKGGVSKLKYSRQLKEKQNLMLERQQHQIQEKQRAADQVRNKIEQLELSGSNEEMKILKLKRQLKVYENMIEQHRKNIDKIENS